MIAVASQEEKEEEEEEEATLQNPVQQYSFLPRTIRDWNDLPQEIIETMTIDTFVSRASSIFCAADPP